MLKGSDAFVGVLVFSAPTTGIVCNITMSVDRIGQDRTGQDRTGQDRTGQDRRGQDRTGLNRILYS